MAAAAVAFVSAACGDGAGRTGSRIIDSSGVQISVHVGASEPLDHSGQLLGTFGGKDSGPEGFACLTDALVAADNSGNLYVLDAQNYLVSVISWSGKGTRILERFSKTIWRAIAVVYRTDPDKDDAFQEAAFRISGHLARHQVIDPVSGIASLTLRDSDLAPLIYVIAWNAAENEHRKLRRHLELSRSFSRHLAARGRRDAPPADSPTEEDSAALLLAIDRLGGNSRKVAALFFVKDLTPSEIASAEHLPIADVEGLIKAARELIDE
jgi:DNA-directed RNA polymerase specialized sigma24 family protein